MPYSVGYTGDSHPVTIYTKQDNSKREREILPSTSQHNMLVTSQDVEAQFLSQGRDLNLELSHPNHVYHISFWTELLPQRFCKASYFGLRTFLSSESFAKFHMCVKGIGRLLFREIIILKKNSSSASAGEIQ